MEPDIAYRYTRKIKMRPYLALKASKNLIVLAVTISVLLANLVPVANLGLGTCHASPMEPPNHPIQSGDRVVFIGGGFIERMQQHDWVEAFLTTSAPGSTYRNLGWGGDTVFGDARAVFGSRADGYARLLRDLDLAKPTVAIVCYGENECYEGQPGLRSFREAYQRLVDDLKTKGSRVIVMLPRQKEASSITEPERTAAYNHALRQYNEQAKQVAATENFPIIDLESFQLNDTLTLDGVYWTEAGYKQAAKEICEQLHLPVVPAPAQMAALRTKINAKNAWFFHRYRPQNETYLFLFRKHEQGNNAVELEQIDPQISELENQIALMAR